MKNKQISRRDFLESTGVGVASVYVGSVADVFAGQSGIGRKKRPNILFVTTDYQAGEDGPTLGSPFLEMPSLKRLCDEGVVFERHYSNSPICIPARYTLISGRYPHYHGKWDNWGGWFKEGTPILMEMLARAGYHTVGVGKMHFDPWDRMAGFTKRIIADRKGGWYIRDDYAEFLRKHGHNCNRLDYGPHVEWEIPGVYDWPFDESLHIDAYVGDQTVGVIERKELKGPWFMWVSFNGPHNPWNPPAKYSDKYKKMNLPRARTRPGVLDSKPPDTTRVRYNYTRNIPDYIDRNPGRRTEIINRIRAGHYGGLTFIDKQIGKIVQALKEQSILDDTIIIYSADHGCHLGDHENIHKGTHFERSARVPFVVWCPSRFHNRRIKSFSSHVDFMPTVLSQAGVVIPESLEGEDLSLILSGRTDSVQDETFVEVRGATSIVTERWKLGIHHTDHEGDLIDMKDDPDELHNLFYDEKYAAIRDKLLEKIYRFNPTAKEQLAKNPHHQYVERDEYNFKAGRVVRGVNAPYQANKNISVVADIEAAEKGCEGPIIISSQGGIHGYWVYVKDRKPAFAVRLWGETELLESGEQLEKGANRIEAIWSRVGQLKLKLNGEIVAEGKAGGCIPVQAGRKRVMAGTYWIGISPKGGQYGKIEKGARSQAKISNVKIYLGLGNETCN
ncbi:MAG: sulfatase family protein [Planctomycetota bacterium]|jgi:arylsulfatase A-like enzyme